MEVSPGSHIPKKKSRYPEPESTFWTTEKSLALTRTRTLDHPARYLVAITATLSRLHMASRTHCKALQFVLKSVSARHTQHHFTNRCRIPTHHLGQRLILSVCMYVYIYKGQDNVHSSIAGLGAGRSGFRIPAGGKDFSLLQTVQTGPRTNAASYGSKAAEIDYTSPAKPRMYRNKPGLPPIWPHRVDRKNFTYFPRTIIIFFHSTSLMCHTYPVLA
jgi:hypothetical protein